ncbi:MAG: histidine phosphatase family protein [Beijerinckiaceae bacterium]
MTHPRIILIRHGETDWNAEGRLQGQQDIPLNATGRAQSQRAGKALLSLMGPRAITDPGLNWIASPLVRATETLDIARASAGLPAGTYRLDARLMELTFGEWEGLTWPEVKERSPESANWREGDKWNFVPPGGESYHMLGERVQPLIDELSSTTILTSHGGIARVLLANLAGMDPQRAALEPIWQGRLLVFERGTWTWVG